MDGLRKVPDNVPNKELLEANLGKPLTRVPDPFGTHPSFGQHNNARCAPSSTSSASTTSSRVRPSTTPRASSTPRFCACWSGSRR
jgi:hypothetical protein